MRMWKRAQNQGMEAEWICRIVLSSPNKAQCIEMKIRVGNWERWVKVKVMVMVVLLRAQH